ncbi:MAG: helix-turn-helix transcriptional regulator [Clostridia bacterium]|nr:helix-turn-helix transcriptional regulator [Clostridia bacterium]
MLKNLKSLRREYGISQQRLADAIFVTQTSVNKYENHDTEPEIEILKRIADYFDTTIDYLVGHSDQRYRPERMKPLQLSPREARLVEACRALPEEKLQCVEQVARLFQEDESPTDRKPT